MTGNFYLFVKTVWEVPLVADTLLAEIQLLCIFQSS